MARRCVCPAPARNGARHERRRVRDPFDSNNDGTLDEFSAAVIARTRLAVFTQLDGVVTSKLRWSFGLRGERREANYRDAGFWQAEDRVTDLQREQQHGGRAVLRHVRHQSTLTSYASISRGYKAGGFNLGAVPQDRLRFRPEYLWNYEYGFKYAAPDRRVYADVSAFYSRRRDVQVRTGAARSVRSEQLRVLHGQRLRAATTTASSRACACS